ncbi:hypothetical protein [Streptomyces sp. NPDC001787]|uniref:hypothetical protein n=1 Tax=Streptomyces sp. NPDC001787 TaxID=3154523 RepID=UPI003319A119
MREFIKTASTAAASVILATGTAGCSEVETEPAPQLPKEFCWGFLTPQELSPLLPTGETATQTSDIFYFADRARQVSCNLYVDGNQGFSAYAELHEDETLIEWSSWDSAKPDPIGVGKKGIVWDNGAATYFACKPTANSGPSAGKFLELRIDVRASRDKEERGTLPKLLKKFTAFAQKELKCT